MCRSFIRQGQLEFNPLRHLINVVVLKYEDNSSINSKVTVTAAYYRTNKRNQ
jgi:hypothetical protein